MKHKTVTRLSLYEIRGVLNFVILTFKVVALATTLLSVPRAKAPEKAPVAVAELYRNSEQCTCHGQFGF